MCNRFAVMAGMLLSLSYAVGSVLSPRGDAAEIELWRGSQPCHVIVYSSSEEGGRAAAEFLGRILQAVSGGVIWEVRKDSGETEGMPFISVGQTLQARATPLAASWQAGRECATVHVTSGNLFLLGSASPMTGVSAFLEGDLGCRWFTDKIVRFPRHDSGSVKVVSRTEVASFAQRMVWTDYDLMVRSREWCAANRVRLLDHFNHPREWFCHTYGKAVPMTEFARHPELFAKINGKPSNTMLCPLEDEVGHRFEVAIRRMMETYPAKRYFSISENDGSYPPCDCASCRASKSRHGGAAIAPHLELVNRVARKVRDRAPSQLVEFLVYSRQFRQCPTNMKLENNVNMWYCANGGLSKTSERRDNFLRWRTLVSHVTLWLYGVDFSNYFRVYPRLYELASDLRFGAEHGVEGAMILEAYGGRTGDQQRLRAWILSKLLWKETLDVDTLAEEYCKGVYGAGWQERLAYYKLVQAAEKAGKSIEDHYGLERFHDLAGPLLEAALNKVKGDALATRELEIDSLPVLLGRLESIFQAYPNNAQRFPQEEYEALLARITSIVRRYGIASLSELKTMEGHLQERRLLLDVLRGGGRLEVFAVDGRIYGYHQAVDKLAVGGRVTRQTCDGGWNVQWVVPVNLLVPQKTYVFSADMRVERESVMAKTCGMGLYDATARKLVWEDLVEGRRLSSSEYRLLRLGKPFRPVVGHEYYVYFTSPAGVDIGSFYVNRIRMEPVD